MKTARMLGAVIAVAVSLSACGQGLRLTTDARLEMLSPRTGDTLFLPVTVRVNAKVPIGRPGSGQGLYLAYFVDRAPLRPGENLLAIVDKECKRVGRSCLTAAYFQQQNVWLTDQTSLELTSMRQVTRRHPSRTVHEVDVVLMDSQNRRVGETIASTRFRVAGLG